MEKLRDAISEEEIPVKKFADLDEKNKQLFWMIYPKKIYQKRELRIMGTAKETG